jgi:pyruvate dehydrogenase E2 component (dihydrolipoamide acetyltransferase)
MIKAVKLAKIGLTMETGVILKWLKAEGDFVQQDDPLLEVETDKSVNTVESFYTGYLKKILVQEGEEIPVETIIAYIGDKDDNIPDAKDGEEVEATGETSPTYSTPHGGPPKATTPAETTPAGSGRINASPMARRLAAEMGVDLSSVTGTGPRGRIGREDILAVAQSSSSQGEGEVPEAGDVEELPLSGVRKVVAERIKASYLDAPHIYLEISVDVSDLDRIRKNTNEKIKDSAHLTVTDFLVRGVTLALKDNPRLNATFQSASIRIFKTVNIGIAVSSAQGLVVPVIKNCGSLSLSQIAMRREELIGRAREGKQTREDLSVGTFTITNLGMLGIEAFQPIINPGQAAILAAGAIVTTPVVDESGAILARKVMRLTLACDHRVVDGAEAARFLSNLKVRLEEVTSLTETG